MVHHAPAVWSGTASIKGWSESTRMVLLTFSLIGLQFTWGIEMTYCTPYLLSLGLTKSRTSLVWIAGPLSGLVMQPIVGHIADRSKSRWGRRRPFMLGGSVIVAISLLTLGWTKELVGLFLTNGERTTIVIAVLTIYVADFAINAVQACCRSLIVDTLPIPQQQIGAAWASRMVAIGHMIGYGFGALDLELIFGNYIGNEQFKRMCVIAAFALLFATAVTSFAVTERVLVSDGHEGDQDSGAWAVLVDLFKTTWNAPAQIQGICWVQFWVWIGYFPFLFYSSTWIGETWARFNPDEARKSKDKLGDIGRIGSTSLIIFSMVTLFASVTLPWFVRSPDEEAASFRRRAPASISSKLHIPLERKPTLLTAWFYSHFIFATAMLCTPFVPSLGFATFLVAVCGIPWAIGGWAPFTFIGVEVNKMETTALPDSPSTQRLTRSSSDSDDLRNPVESTGQLAGVYLGILNVYVTLPQFVGTAIATIVFSIVDETKDGPNAISVCLFVGAFSVLGAAYGTNRLKYIL